MGFLCIAATGEQDKKPHTAVTAKNEYFSNWISKENVKHLSLHYPGKIEKISAIWN